MTDLDLLPSKLLALLVRPDFWLWLGLMAALWTLYAGWNRIARWIVWSLVLAVTLVGFVPVGSVWLAPLEGRFPANATLPRPPSAIIVLGGGEDALPGAGWPAPAVNEAGDRFVQALHRAMQYPDVPVVFTGGAFDPTGDPMLADGAERVAAMLVAMGIDPEQLHIASGARTTAEHPSDVRPLLGELNIQPSDDAPLLLITSAFHMPRAMGVFCAAGLGPIVADPTDFRTSPGQAWRHAVRWDYAHHLGDLQVGIREWAGLVAYRLGGRTASLLPSTCP